MGELKAKVVSYKELTDPELNPTTCLSPLRIFDDCINCEVFKRAMKKHDNDPNAVAQKLRCKPHVSERVKALVARKVELTRELEAVNEAIKENKKIAPMVGGA